MSTRLFEMVIGGVVVGLVGGLVAAYPQHIVGFFSNLRVIVTAAAVLQWVLLLRIQWMFIEGRSTFNEQIVMTLTLSCFTGLAWGALMHCLDKE